MCKATQPSEITRSGNSDNLNTCIVINDKSQSSVVAHLRRGWHFSYHFTVYLLLQLAV